jgi:hypothetical protein
VQVYDPSSAVDGPESEFETLSNAAGSLLPGLQGDLSADVVQQKRDLQDGSSQATVSKESQQQQSQQLMLLVDRQVLAAALQSRHLLPNVPLPFAESTSNVPSTAASRQNMAHSVEQCKASDNLVDTELTVMFCILNQLLFDVFARFRCKLYGYIAKRIESHIQIP